MASKDTLRENHDGVVIKVDILGSLKLVTKSRVSSSKIVKHFCTVKINCENFINDNHSLNEPSLSFKM